MSPKQLPTVHSELHLSPPTLIADADQVELSAIVFKDGPNRNHFRFRPEHLAEFCSSFVTVPFLVDHDVRHVSSRIGRVTGALLSDRDFVFQLKITSDMGRSMWRQGLIDRFSIGWYYDAISCSVCGNDWLSPTCSHWPGQSYTSPNSKQTVVCELIFENPRGKEVSAVNAPAVEGTTILSTLQTLKQEALMSNQPQVDALQAPAAIVDDTALGTLADDMRAALLDARLMASGLPLPAQEAVRQMTGRRRFDLAEVDSLIDSQRRLIAAMAPQIVGHDPVDAGKMRTGREQFDLAFEAMLAGRQAPNGVRPLSGIREAYILMTGDYEMSGVFRPENVGLAAVDTTSMAGLVASALNKSVVNAYQMYPRWWEPIVTAEDFQTLQTVRWITLGGVGELPTVNEGAAYTEMTWDDNTETSTWSKKGGYLGITLESIDRDDTRKIQQAPRAIAQAAWLSLSKAVSNIFTTASGTGPTLADSVVLFHSNHSNIGTTALSYAAWVAVRTAMRKQTELNSSERLGALTAPKYLLVPPDLEGTALTILLSEAQPDTANNNENPWAEGETRDARLTAARRRVIVVDLWTDTNNWAAVADPMLYSSIGLGFRFGREPQIFSVADPNSGLLFSNDVMPVKARFFFATGPTNYRGLYKQNVA